MDTVTFSDSDFCRECGITVSWTSDSEWLHDYPPEIEHDPVVPYHPSEDDLYDP